MAVNSVGADEVDWQLRNSGPGDAFDVRLSANAGAKPVGISGQYNFEVIDAGQAVDFKFGTADLPADTMLRVAWVLDDGTDESKTWRITPPDPTDPWGTPF